MADQTSSSLISMSDPGFQYLIKHCPPLSQCLIKYRPPLSQCLIKHRPPGSLFVGQSPCRVKHRPPGFRCLVKHLDLNVIVLLDLSVWSNGILLCEDVEPAVILSYRITPLLLQDRSTGYNFHHHPKSHCMI